MYSGALSYFSWLNYTLLTPVSLVLSHLYVQTRLRSWRVFSLESSFEKADTNQSFIRSAVILFYFIIPFNPMWPSDLLLLLFAGFWMCTLCMSVINHVLLLSCRKALSHPPETSRCDSSPSQMWAGACHFWDCVPPGLSPGIHPVWS